MSDLQDLIHKTSMDCLQRGRLDEQRRIIALLEDYDFSNIWRQIEWSPNAYEGFGAADLIALIKGEK